MDCINPISFSVGLWDKNQIPLKCDLKYAITPQNQLNTEVVGQVLSFSLPLSENSLFICNSCKCFDQLLTIVDDMTAYCG